MELIASILYSFQSMDDYILYNILIAMRAQTANKVDILAKQKLTS